MAGLVGLCSAPLPDRSAVMTELQQIGVSLNMLSFQEIDALARSGCATFGRALVRRAMTDFRARLTAT